MRTHLRKRFGGHCRTLRRDRSLTQEVLAARSDLSVDAIRRIERGTFSPSLETLGKLSTGLEVSLHTLFQQLAQPHAEGVSEICDYLGARSRNEVRQAWRVLRAMFDDAPGG